MSGIAVPFVLLLAFVVAVVLSVLRRRRPHAAIAGVGRRLTEGVVPTASAIALLERWRDRAARWRTVLAGPVVVATLAASVMLRASVDVGVGGHPAWSDPLLMGLLSVFLGAIAAELHHLRPRAAGRRTVDLTPRVVADYLPPGARRRLAVLAGLAVAAGLLAAVLARPRPPWLALLALAVAGLVVVVQRGIVVRGRPAVAADLRAADDAVRRLAVRSVDEAGAGAMLLLTAWQVAGGVARVEVPVAVGAIVVVALITAVVVAIVWWRRGNPKRLLPDVPGALGAGRPLEAQP